MARGHFSEESFLILWLKGALDLKAHSWGIMGRRCQREQRDQTVSVITVLLEKQLFGLTGQFQEEWKCT